MIPVPASPPPRYAEVAITQLPHGAGQSWRVVRRFDSAAECLAVLPRGRLLVVKGKLTFEAFYCMREPLHPPKP